MDYFGFWESKVWTKKELNNAFDHLPAITIFWKGSWPTRMIIFDMYVYIWQMNWYPPIPPETLHLTLPLKEGEMKIIYNSYQWRR